MCVYIWQCSFCACLCFCSHYLAMNERPSPHPSVCLLLPPLLLVSLDLSCSSSLLTFQVMCLSPSLPTVALLKRQHKLDLCLYISTSSSLQQILHDLAVLCLCLSFNSAWLYYSFSSFIHRPPLYARDLTQHNQKPLIASVRNITSLSRLPPPLLGGHSTLWIRNLNKTPKI